MPFGIALAGGGIRAAAHIGVLKALEEEGLKPQSLSGTSAGSVVAGLIALGYSAKDLWSIALELGSSSGKFIDPDYLKLIGAVKNFVMGKRVTLTGLIKGNKLEKLFERLSHGCDIRDIKTPLAIPTVDLFSGLTQVYTNNGRQARPLKHCAWKFQGKLSQIMRQSCSVPVVFCPIVKNGQCLVDGGLTDVLPVNLLKAIGEKTVIAVDLDTSENINLNINIMEIASRSLDIMGDALKNCSIRGHKYVINPNLPAEAGLLSFDAIAQCLTAGYRSAKEQMAQIKTFINSEDV